MDLLTAWHISYFRLRKLCMCVCVSCTWLFLPCPCVLLCESTCRCRWDRVDEKSCLSSSMASVCSSTEFQEPVTCILYHIHTHTHQSTFVSDYTPAVYARFHIWEEASSPRFYCTSSCTPVKSQLRITLPRLLWVSFSSLISSSHPRDSSKKKKERLDKK